MPWLTKKIIPKLYQNKISKIKAIQIGIIHEITQELSDKSVNYRNKFLFFRNPTNSIFDFYIAADPTLLLKNPIVYKTGRLIKKYNCEHPHIPEKLTIGSFGFATPNKGFEKIIELVQAEFEESIIKINIPPADFGDSQGENAKKIEENCKKLIRNPKIKLEITHDFLEGDKILDFLSRNSINIFLYEDSGPRGISSTIEYAMAVNKPIAISNNSMFRHILDIQPSICVNNNSLKKIIENGSQVLNERIDDWSEENMIWEYERIIASVLQIKNLKKKGVSTLKQKIKRILSIPMIENSWIKDSKPVNTKNNIIKNDEKYSIVSLPKEFYLNRTLDAEARKIYKPAINMLWKLSPEIMEKKIPEANIQQAFVFDTVLRFIHEYENPKILCAGSYEDTASISLKRLGLKIKEIDPMINYSLQEYTTKPNTKHNFYDIIFSTSVIEHDPDDKSFMHSIDKLLAPGGIFIMTCDYKNDWIPGDNKPTVDMRLYRESDLTKRLLSYTNNCQLLDRPSWEPSKPDFNFLGKHQYSFASFVLKKNK
jgi:SAM-dependent methyltransferase